MGDGERCKHCTAYSDPSSVRPRAARVGSLRSTSLPHCGYGGGSSGPACMVSGCLASATQPVSLISAYHQPLLCDSVGPASPQVQWHPFTAVKVADAPVLHAKVTIEPVPPADMKTGFYSPYFIVPKKGGVLRSILDLRILNRALHRLPFKMLMQKRNFGCIRPQNWFAVIDLKDAYFHVPILLCHRSFLRFAFEGRAYQYKVLPGSYTAEAASYETT